MQQLKLHEIANSLVDAITTMPILAQASKWDQETRPSSLLSHLHSLLSAFTDGGHNTLVDMLYRKMAQAHSVVSSTIPPLLTCTRPVKNRSLAHDTEPIASESGSSTKVPTDTIPADWLSEEEGAPCRSAHETNRISPRIPNGVSDAATASVPFDFASQQFSDTWNYSQSLYEPLMYSPPQDFGTGAGGLTTPGISGSLDIRSLDTVFNNVVFDTSPNQLPPGAYLPIVNVPGDPHSTVNI